MALTSCVWLAQAWSGDEVESGKLIGKIELAGERPHQAERLVERLDVFLRQPATAALLDQIAAVAVAHAGENDWPVVMAAAAPPDASGTVILTIHPGKAASVSVTGGKHLSAVRKVAAKEAKRLEGEVLSSSELEATLDRLNANSFAQATLAAAPHEGDPGAADLELKLSDDWPWRVSFSYDNAGVAPLGQSRWHLGTEWGNALGLGHSWFTDTAVGADPEDYFSQSLVWKMPLPWEHELVLSGAYARTHATAEHSDEGLLGHDHLEVDVEGDTWLASARYAIPYRISRGLRVEAQLGFDFRQFDSGLAFGEAETFDQSIQVGALTAGMLARWKTGRHTGGFSFETAWSPGNWLGHDDEATYSTVVSEADSEFWVVRASFADRWDFKKASLTVKGGGQWADGPLLPSEDIVLASASAVRGYDERSILGQHGVWSSIEAATAFAALPGNVLAEHSLAWSAAAFLDGGYAWVSDTMHGENRGLLAAGVGLRLRLASSFACSCEAAWPLINGEGPRLHLAATLTF